MKRLSSSAWATRHHQPIHGRQLPITASIDAGEVVVDFGTRRCQIRAEGFEHATLIACDEYRLLIEDSGGMLVKYDEEGRDWIIVASWNDMELTRPQREARLSEKEAKAFQAGFDHGQDLVWEGFERMRRDLAARELVLR